MFNQIEIGTTSAQNQEVRLKDLFEFNSPFHNVEKKDYLYNCYKVMQIKLNGQKFEIYNRLPGEVDEIFVQNKDYITLDSVLYTLKTEYNQSIDIGIIQNTTQIRNRIKINIIKKDDKVKYKSDHSEIKENLKQIIGHNSTCFKIQLLNDEIQEIEFNILKELCPYQVFVIIISGNRIFGEAVIGSSDYCKLFLLKFIIIFMPVETIKNQHLGPHLKILKKQLPTYQQLRRYKAELAKKIFEQTKLN